MKPGSPGFVGARLTEARKARGLTQAALAELLGVTRAAVSQYEGGQATPRADVLMKVASTLNVRPEFFVLPPRDPSTRTVFFRSSASATKRARERGVHKLFWLADCVAELSARLNLPAAKLPAISLPTSPAEISDEMIEEAATTTRRHWGLGDGPITNVVWLLENNGIVVARGAFSEKRMDSFSTWELADQRPMIFLSTDKASAVRSRWDAAHELAHLLLHNGFPVTSWSSATEVSVRESQAHRFAGAFLLPEEPFCEEVVQPDLDVFATLKRRWLVSIQAQIIRARDLGLLTDAAEVRLWRNLARRRWRTREPMDDEIPPEEPRRLKVAFQTLADLDSQAPLSLLEQVRLSEADFADLAGLPEPRHDRVPHHPPRGEGPPPHF